MTPNHGQRVVVALDTSDWNEFRLWCRLFGPRVGLLKVGLEAYVKWGPAAVDEARSRSGVFLDLKLHDIPNTVAGAVAAARDLGADYVTAHATGGTEMLRAAVGAGEGRVGILAVTLLTHLDKGSLRALGIQEDPETLVSTWGKLAAQAGCAGAVCSPREVSRLRGDLPAAFVLATPGIRPADTSSDDQKRIATPAVALAAGADLLVVGRPLTRAADPEAALERLLADLEAGG